MATNSRERSVWSDLVAAQVRAERAASGMTQDDVWKAAGLSRSTYVRIEKGSHVADATQIARLCQVFGLSLSAFFERVEDRARRS